MYSFVRTGLTRKEKCKVLLHHQQNVRWLLLVLYLLRMRHNVRCRLLTIISVRAGTVDRLPGGHMQTEGTPVRLHAD